MAVTIPFVHELDFEYGEVVTVSPGIRRVIANNPSPFTFHGTGTYIIGEGDVAIVDPGPRDEAHIRNLLKATEGERITHVLVTHTHMDHSPGCALLDQYTDAPTYAYGPHGAGSEEKGIKVEEGGDMEFNPTHRVVDGQIIEGGNWSVECVYTPGHTSNHMCFQHRESEGLFTGDHVMGWSTSIISPPDGDMAAYMQSLNKLLVRDDKTYWPTHGAPITDPKPFVETFITHREEREAQIIQCIKSGTNTIVDMVPQMYADLPEFMYPAAARSALAAIAYLVQKGELLCEGEVNLQASYFLA
jgi:glyoxylase-like metal-dependent hydrolase (beta-lactamase superfamily II)